MLLTASVAVPTEHSPAPIPELFDLQKVISDNRLQGLWRMMSGFRLIYIIATLSQGVAATARTGTYLLLRYFIDNVLGKGIFDRTLIWIAAGFVGLALVEGSFSFFSGTLAARTSEGMALRLRNYLFDHIQRLTFTYHSKTPTGELIQRSTSDVDAVRRFFADQAINAGRIVLLFIINFVAMLNLHWRLALFSIIVVPVIILVSIFFFQRITKAYEANQEQEATLSTTLQENLTGVRVVKAFARQDFEREKFDRENWEKYLRGRKLLRMHSLFWPITDIICAGQMISGFTLAAIMAINGVITVGTYLAYVGLVIWLIFPMRNLGRLIVQMSTGLVSFGRVMDVVKEEQEPLQQGEYTPKDGLRGEVEFINVGFEYDSENRVLKDITFNCKPGQVIALLGSTGSGKTTLVNLLPRFFEYTRGCIKLDSVEIKQYPRIFLRQQIGIVEQEPFLFSRTIRENITYGVGREVPDHEVEAAAKAAAIHDVIISFPDGYKTLVGEKGVTLSGGQKQRVAIARTLLKNPCILILDDSTSSVDTETEAEIREALNRLMMGRTTFIIAHRIQSVMNADLILVMDKGSIVQMGNHEELVAQPGPYLRIYEIQSRIEDELNQEITGVSTN